MSKELDHIYAQYADKCREMQALQNKNAQLKAQVAAQQWQPITPENLPKVGDELLGMADKVEKVYANQEMYNSERWRQTYWTHFRPINPPKERP